MELSELVERIERWKQRTQGGGAEVAAAEEPAPAAPRVPSRAPAPPVAIAADDLIEEETALPEADGGAGEASAGGEAEPMEVDESSVDEIES